MRFLFLVLFLAGSGILQAQQKVIVAVCDRETRLPVPATIQLTPGMQTFVTDSLGRIEILFPTSGRFALLVSSVNYETKELQLEIPHTKGKITIELIPAEHELEEIIVRSTRTSRTIANAPTRVEAINLEEIDEKSNMRPANVMMLLHESTGIQVQQTSATSGNASIRIQGLDGRYTQLLKDGFANFGNFSGGLSVLEIPPLDLKQVEIIKGPASTLYGGGAIAGVINFISKTPEDRPEYSFILNHSNIGQSNIGAFASGRGKKAGYTLLALYNHSKAYDVDKDHFSEIPEANEVTVHPKLFLYPSPTTTISLGNSFTTAKRMGGDMRVIQKGSTAEHQYFEKNHSLRNISTIELEKRWQPNKRLVIKQSFSVFDREIGIPGYNFNGIDFTGFSDVAYIRDGEKHDFVIGGNFIINDFRRKDAGNDLDYVVQTGGAYGQHTWDVTEKVILESGLRMDVANYRNFLFSSNELFVLPRVSMLFKFNSHWSSRLGGGLGYKTPTLFTEEAESFHYRNINPLHDVKSERSYGGTADVHFRSALGANFLFSLNHMFYYTTIRKPVILESAGANWFAFVNASHPVHSRGFETNAKLIFREHLKLFLGYTFTDTRAKHLGKEQMLPLVPKNKLNSALIYEKHGALKLGLEGYFTGRQQLSNGTFAPAYSEFGFMAEKFFNRFSLFINFENFTDTRQSRYQQLATGSHEQPEFQEIWTHTEGFVVNGGIKIKL